MSSSDEWVISIFVPTQPPIASTVPKDEAENHSLDIGSVFHRITNVNVEKVQHQWSRTVDALMNLSSLVSEKSREWQVDEIEVGLTLSAKGELLFIAEAGAEASIKFKLKKRGAAA